MNDQPALISILFGNEPLQKLVSTWPNAFKKYKSMGNMAPVSDMPPILVSIWSDLSGVFDGDLKRLWNRMFDNRLTRDDGTSDALALQTITTIWLMKIQGNKKKPEPKQKKGAA